MKVLRVRKKAKLSGITPSDHHAIRNDRSTVKFSFPFGIMSNSAGRYGIMYNNNLIEDQGMISLYDKDRPSRRRYQITESSRTYRVLALNETEVIKGQNF